MDGQYKDILTLLFVRRLRQPRPIQTALLMPAGGSADDMLAARATRRSATASTRSSKLAEANGLRNVIDQADFNDELGKGKRCRTASPSRHHLQ